MKKGIVTAIVGGIVEAVIGIIVTRLWTSGMNVLLAVLILNTVGLIVYVVYLRIKLQNESIKLQNLRNVGITDCTKELKGTPFEPDRCMKSTRTSLSFMGVGGAKWVEQDSDKVLFIEMLNRVAAAGGGVHFLLLDPDSEGYQQLKKLRGNAVPIQSYNIFAELVKKHECLKIHLYDYLPSFRLQFVDDQYVAVSRYYFERESFDQTVQGWGIPHLIVHAEEIAVDGSSAAHRGSLYMSFKYLYDYIWKHSRDISSWSAAHSGGAN